MQPSATDISTKATEMYLDLLGGCLSRTVIPEFYEPFTRPSRPIFRMLFPPLRRFLNSKGIELVRPYRMTPEMRLSGTDFPWPPDAETMIGTKRLLNLRYCVRTVIEDQVPGDFIETGVWRGGACIFMRGALRVYGDTSRTVWVADSFEGLPKPDPKYPADNDDKFWTFDALRVSLEQVKENFARYGMLDDRVKFLKGWFKDTLPTAPIEKLAILRLDGDMYESTMDGLKALYDKVSPGGFIIVDDYYCVKGCQTAVDEFRDERRIRDEIFNIDGMGSYWRKS
jgi:O-methyltransferase